MSLKRRIQYKYTNFINAIRYFELPTWCESLALRAWLLVFIFILGTAYITKTSSTTTTGYELHKMEKQVELLSQETRKIDIQITEYSSMNSIETRLAGLNMVKASMVKYIVPVGATVAKK